MATSSSGLVRHRLCLRVPAFAVWFSLYGSLAAPWMRAQGPALLPTAPAAGSAAAGSTAAGQITGQVQDATGAILPGAHVEIRRPGGGLVVAAESDAGGQFRLPAPAPGDYRLSVVRDGFETVERVVRVGRGAPAALTVTLKVASLATTVTVTAADAVELAAPDANQDTPSISSEEMKTLPMLDNDVVSTLSSLLNTGAAGEGGATLVVDGVEMKSVGVSASAIERASINQDPYSAQYKQPGRGQIEVITKSTSDKFHGGGTWTFRDAAMAATNRFATVKAPEQRRTYEGYVTGPIRPLKRTTFLFSISHVEDDAYAQVNATEPTGRYSANVQAPYRNTQLTMKVAHRTSDRHASYMLYRFFDTHRSNSNVGGQTLPEAGLASSYFDMDITFHDDLILSPTKLNQFNILFERNIDRTTSETPAPAVVVQGAFTGGGAQTDTLQTENNPNISDIVSWTAHRIHQIKFGVQIPNLGRRVLEDGTDRQGTYTFASLSAFQQNQPETFSIQQGQTRFVTHFDQPGAFFQDQIQVTPRLSVTPGVRYDFQNALPGTMDAVQPRLSVAYVLDGSRALVVRTGAGIYMRRVGVNVGQQLARYEYAAERSLLLTQNLCYPEITRCNALAAQPPNLFNFAPGLKAPMQGYFGLSVERQLTKKSTVTLGYTGYRGWHALREVDVNAPVPGRTSTVRPNANLGQVLQQQSGGYQKSDGLQASLRGRLGPVFSGYLQYEYQHADANTEWSTFTPQDQTNPNGEWSRTNWDQRHRLNLFGTLFPDKPLNLGLGFYGYTGTPYTITSGRDDFHTGILNARPAGVPRNSLNSSGYQDVQVRLGYTWKLRPRLKDGSPTVQLSLSSFNTLNRVNYGGYVGVVTSPEFMRPTEAGNPRRLQLGAGYNF
ncbi:MAG: TonB-dependent receptor [Acidobacteriota bacterium]|nr:TonB-dependent receptor [Acidobacteriota bacterium]